MNPPQQSQILLSDCVEWQRARLPGVGIGCDAIGVRPIVFQNWEFPIQFLHQLTLR